MTTPQQLNKKETPKYLIKQFIHIRADHFAREPACNRDKEFNIKVLNILCRIKPPIEFFKIAEINDLVTEKVKQLLLQINNQKSDVKFLVSLGNKNNWKEECMICHTENPKNTDDRSDITILRPCGHSVCLNPCFKKMLEEHNIIYAPDERIFVDELTKEELSTTFCPLCKKMVKHAFQPYDIVIPYFLEDKDVKLLIDECLNIIAT
jgi:hypothetical protein